jgi:uncharacterized membrane protein YbhN (UPF0104 family)
MAVVETHHFPRTPSSPGPDRRRAARLAVTLVAATLLVGGLVLHRDAARLALRDLGGMSAGQVALVLAAVAVHKLVHASLLWASLPGLSKRRALVVNEIHTGCTNSTVGGSAVGTGLKVAMLRSAGHCERAIAASIVCTGAATSVALWATAWLQAVPRVLLGEAKGGELLVAVAGTGVITGAVLFWWSVLFVPPVTRLVARAFDAVRAPVARRSPRVVRTHLEALDVHAEVERLRTLGHLLVRTRLGAIAAAAMASQVTIALVLVATLVALQPAGGVPLAGVVGAFALARVLGSLAPLPGGIGVLDVGLAAGLVHLGIPHSTALAAIGLFRAVTFVLPIATGMLCLFVARRLDAFRRPDPTRPDPSLPVPTRPDPTWPGPLAELPAAVPSPVGSGLAAA